ncbi:MAG: hypothetical protein PHE54_05320 [Bacilli bacterium]|nr:hypothetical protein [Bacilli bacterium]
MAFNKEISGYRNEMEFVKHLNNKYVYQLDPMFSGFIYDIFSNVSVKDRIIAKLDENKKKYDIIIVIKNNVKRISIKKGIKNSVHVEAISEFIHFLIENNISRDSVVEYLKYNYADGTTNGSGDIRISGEEYKKLNQDKIDTINKEINNEDLLNKIVDRFILKGNYSDIRIDALIYGVVEDFIWIKAEDIRKIILSKIDVYSTGVHFSVLSCQPLNRCLNYNPQYQTKRFSIQIKWYNIFDDIIEYMNNNL